MTFNNCILEFEKLIDEQDALYQRNIQFYLEQKSRFNFILKNASDKKTFNLVLECIGEGINAVDGIVLEAHTISERFDELLKDISNTEDKKKLERVKEAFDMRAKQHIETSLSFLDECQDLVINHQSRKD